MLTREQIEAIVRLAGTPRYGYHAEYEARRIGITVESLRTHVSNYRNGRVPESWRRALGEDSR